MLLLFVVMMCVYHECHGSKGQSNNTKSVVKPLKSKCHGSKGQSNTTKSVKSLKSKHPGRSNTSKPESLPKLKPKMKRPM